MITKQELEALYFGEGLSYRLVAKQLGVYPKTVLLNMKRYNLKLRPLKKAIKDSIIAGRWAIRKGKNSSLWKGGKLTDPYGYKLLNIAHLTNYEVELFKKMFFGHHKRLIFEHRLVMARYLDRPLTKSEQVHHLNGIVDDNRLENLLLLNGKKHKDVIPALQRRIKQLEAIVSG